jgi:hypothetical protein
MGNKQHSNKTNRYIPSLFDSGSQKFPGYNNLHALINFFYINMKLLIVACLWLFFCSPMNAQPTDNYPFQVKKDIVKRDFRFWKEVVRDYEMENKVLEKESKRCMRNIKRHTYPFTNIKNYENKSHKCLPLNMYDKFNSK